MSTKPDHTLPQGAEILPSLPCFLNDADCVQRTKEALQRMAFKVWVYTLASGSSGKMAEKQRLINEGMADVIKTALGDYSKEIFNSTMASFKVELKDDTRIKNAYKKGDNKPMSPDSCVIPTYREVGKDFVFMYKMNISSINKNAANGYNNLFGEISEFHWNLDNMERYLVMMNATPRISVKPGPKDGTIVPEVSNFDDYTARMTVQSRESPGTKGYQEAMQTAIVDMKFDWHPDVIAAIETRATMRKAIQKLGLASILTDTMDLSGIEKLVIAVVKSYDPLHEFKVETPLEFDPFPDVEDGDDDMEYPF